MQNVSTTQPPSPTVQTRLLEKPEEEKQPSASLQGANPEEKPRDDRVAKIDQLQRLFEKANGGDNLRLSIDFDEQANRFIYRGLDPSTGEVVREYPPEELRASLGRLREIAGLSVDKSL